MKPRLACLVMVASALGCGGGFDAPAAEIEAATPTSDAAPWVAADAGPEGGSSVDASDSASDWVDVPVEGPTSDAGAPLDGALAPPEDAAAADGSSPQDASPDEAPVSDAAAAIHDHGAVYVPDVASDGAGEAVESDGGADASIPADQGPSADGSADVPPVDAAPTIDSAPPDMTWCGNLTFATTTAIEGGKTVAICAGSVLTFGPSASLVVQGTLLAQGTAAMPIRFVGQQASAGGWGGVTVYAGGAVELDHTEIHHATMAFSTAASVRYALDYVVLGDSLQLLHLMSSGTVAHATMHAMGEVQSSIGDPVVIDNASPHIVDSTIDNGSSGSDQIQVNGLGSAPVFERMDVSHSHCCFHFNSATKATIESSSIHDCMHGLMIIYSVDSLLTGNNFQRNDVALGYCFGGTAIFRGNFVDGAFADATCADQQNQTPVAAPIVGCGPMP